VLSCSTKTKFLIRDDLDTQNQTQLFTNRNICDLNKIQQVNHPKMPAMNPSPATDLTNTPWKTNRNGFK